MNIAEIEMRLSDLIREPFNGNEFALRLLEIYGAPRAALTKLRTGSQNKGEQTGDLLWARKLYFRVAPQGRAAEVLEALKQSKATKAQKPRFLLTTDGCEIAAYDTKIDDSLHCDNDKLNDRFDFFLPLAGIEKYEAVAENPADIKAAGRLAKLHDEIERHNPDWLVPGKRHALNQFLTRILFCMFAEDTGSFPQDLFVKTVSEFGGFDGEHLQGLLKQVFDAMNVPEDQRQHVPAHIGAFPYVNGGLFADSTEVPKFNRRAKRMLVEAAQLDWREINPDIFGSMIQAVVDTDMRGDLGMHYTSVPNIMKVLQPLFLMALEDEFERARGHREERSLLRKVLTRISKTRVFDPACGSGNFLIIAYRELRTLEMRIFQRLDEIGGGQTTWREQSGVKLSNFYGIEVADFAAETAKLSLWIAEYQMDQRFKRLFGEAPKSFPLRAGGHIICNNALRIDWLQVCPPPTKIVQKEKILDLAHVEKVHAVEEVIDYEVQTYIVGNPPYLGNSIQTEQQKDDLAYVFSLSLENYLKLDYVACWYFKAANYLKAVNSEAALVATNSICQGEQVALLWPLILDRGIEIGFAHTSFKWSNNASKNAAVMCIIVGLRKRSSKAAKFIFNGNIKVFASNVNPYLLDFSDIYITRRSAPLSELKPMDYGNKPTDGGHLLLEPDQMRSIVAAFPEAAIFVRKYVGSREYIQGVDRYCLWITDDQLPLARSIPPIAERIEKVRSFRAASTKLSTQAKARFPHQFEQIRHFNDDLIIVPAHFSENRQYLTVGFLSGSEAVVSNACLAIYQATPIDFSLMCSRLHCVWTACVGGRIKTDYRYSNLLVYNTFPVPPLQNERLRELEDATWEIIAAREASPGKTIAWLYDPETMPERLLNAHRSLDNILEKIYIGRPFKSDIERLEHLFKLYAEMTSEKQKEVANA